MSVFTVVSEPQLNEFLRQYAVGSLQAFRGIEEGIENTNYFVDTDSGRFVLTLFERTEFAGLPFFLGVMRHLADGGIPSARPQPGRDGHALRELNGRPAALVERLSGAGVELPTPEQCAQVATVMARMHMVGRGYAGRRANCRGARWWETVAGDLDAHLAPADRELLRDELAYQRDAARIDLPGGVIHADLFRDNALFDRGRLTGLIDFYYACTDAWIYDLAVLVNDWAINARGSLDMPAYTALVAAYVAERVPSDLERAHWNGKLRAAALRFWVSRLQDLHFPRAAELTYTKDPLEFRRILEFHRNQTLEL